MDRLNPIAIVIVNFNTQAWVLRCIASLYKLGRDDLSLILVDNSPKPDTAQVQVEYPKTIILRIENNGGFAAGCNQGILYALRHNASFVLLLNPDCRAQSDFVQPLLNAMDGDKNLAVVSPHVVNDVPPNRTLYAGGYMNFWRGGPKHKLVRPHEDQIGAISTDFVSGCAMLIRSEAIRETGLIDECFFLYYEDADYVLRLRNKGWKIAFVPEAVIEHAESCSISRRSHEHVFLVARNRLWFLRRWSPVVPLIWYYLFTLVVKLPLSFLALGPRLGLSFAHGCYQGVFSKPSVPLIDPLPELLKSKSSTAEQPLTRVGLFSYNFLPIEGGQGRNFYQLFTRLKKPGLVVHAFSPHSKLHRNHHSLLRFTRSSQIGQLVFALWVNVMLPKIVSRFRIDIAIFNGGPAGSFLLFHPKIPTIYYANHSYRQQSQLVPRERWKALFVPLERHGYRLADLILSNSSTTRNELTGHYKLPWAKIRRVPVGVDTDWFKPGLASRIPNSVFFLGRLERRKGPHFLLNGIKLAKAEIEDLKLFMAGEGKQGDELKEKVTRIKLSRNTTFLGRLPEEEVPQWLRKCVVHVMPSIFEGFGIVALEAMASGCVVIATRGSGAEDFIRDGVNGFLIDYGDTASLCNRIVETLRNPDLIASLSQQARRTVVDEYSLEQTNSMLLKAIKDL